MAPSVPVDPVMQSGLHKKDRWIQSEVITDICLISHDFLGLYSAEQLPPNDVIAGVENFALECTY